MSRLANTVFFDPLCTLSLFEQKREINKQMNTKNSLQTLFILVFFLKECQTNWKFYASLTLAFKSLWNKCRNCNSLNQSQNIERLDSTKQNIKKNITKKFQNVNFSFLCSKYYSELKWLKYCKDNFYCGYNPSISFLH